MGEREERRGERKRKKGRTETPLATENFPSRERGKKGERERNNFRKERKKREIMREKEENERERGRE